MAESDNRIQTILNALAREIRRQDPITVDELDMVTVATAIDSALGAEPEQELDDSDGLEPEELNAANDM